MAIRIWEMAKAAKTKLDMTVKCYLERNISQPNRLWPHTKCVMVIRNTKDNQEVSTGDAALTIKTMGC